MPFHTLQTDRLGTRQPGLPRASAPSLVTTGKLAVDLDAKSVEVEGRPVRLTGKEYRMLELLALQKGSVLTTDMFMSHLYGALGEPEPRPKIISVFICKLRRKLATASRDKYIGTVWGRGYTLRDRANERAA